MVSLIRGIHSKFNIAFPQNGDGQVSNSVQYIEKGVSVSFPDGKRANVEPDKGKSALFSKIQVTEYAHGEKNGTKTENSASYGASFILGVELKFTEND